jgi:cytidylate kinase
MAAGRERPVVAIDGPAGVGKSTAARMLARELGFTLVDTGALYRAVALAAAERGVSWDDGPALARTIEAAIIDLGTDTTGQTRVLIGGADRSRDIRTPVVSMGASAVSRHPEVRGALLGMQRRLGRVGGVVLEGRDIGTVVFPDAEVKVYLTASPEVRARRRYEELAARGEDVSFEETLAEVVQRDCQDSTRETAPLRAADDAVVIDTSSLSAAEVVERVVEMTRGAGSSRVQRIPLTK